MARSAREPQKKRRKRNPQQPGDVDKEDDHYTLLLAAMEVVIEAFLGGECSLDSATWGYENESSSENDEDENQSSEENVDDEDGASEDTDGEVTDGETKPSENGEDEDGASEGTDGGVTDDKTESSVGNDEDEDGASEDSGEDMTDIDLLKNLRGAGKSFKVLVDEELDRRLEHEVTDELVWQDSNRLGNQFELELSLSTGLDDYPGPDEIMKRCQDFVDPENHSDAFMKGRFDYEAAKKAFRKDGAIQNVFQFYTSKKAKDNGGIWSVESQCDEEIIDTAFEQLEALLVDGDGFTYPLDYDSFGVNEFDEKFDAKEFSELKEQLWIILCRAKSVKYSFWEGHYDEYDYGVHDSTREEFYTFSTYGGRNFVLIFRHAFIF